MDLRSSGAALRAPGMVYPDTSGFNRPFLLQAQKGVILGAVQQSQSLYLRRH
jgi:hypothetical protein